MQTSWLWVSVIICGPTFSHFLSVCVLWLSVIAPRIIWRHLTDAPNLAQELRKPTHSIIQARASPHRATSQFAAIYMLTSFPSIPHGNQGHKTNMCCFTSADKKDRMLLSSCFAHIWGVFFFPLTPELIKLDALWMPSPICCLCKQLGRTKRFNVTLLLGLIRCL